MKEKRKSKREKSINKFTQIYMKIIFFILLFSLFFSCNAMNDILPDRSGNNTDIKINDDNNNEDNNEIETNTDIENKKIILLKLDIRNPDADDNVSFSESDFLEEIIAFEGDSISIYYTLSDINKNNELVLSFGPGTESITIFIPTTFFCTYIVNPLDAINGVIVVTADFIHTDLIPLDPPIHVHFDKTGKITFDPGANNTMAGAIYTYTLYKENNPVSGFTDIEIAKDGEIIPALVTQMLSAEGSYLVKLKARTVNPLYTSTSIESAHSEAVNVCLLTININGNINAEKITVEANGNEEDYTAPVRVFGSTNIKLTAIPDPYRYVQWSSINGTGYICIMNITGNTTITVTFKSPDITITRQPASFLRTAPGFTTILTAEATATNATPVSYQWYSNTANSNTGGTAISGEINSSFTIPTSNFTDGEIRYYYCVISAPGGAVSRTTSVSTVQKVFSSTITMSHPVVPIHILSPLDTKMTFTVEVSGFLNDGYTDGVRLTVTTTGGLTISGNNATHKADSNGTKTFNIEVTYNGTASFLNGFATITITGVTGIPTSAAGFNYSYTHVNRTATVQIRDGQTVSNSIPVTQNNIGTFNGYASTANGRTRHYIQTEDITLPNIVNNWTPIVGTFTGTYDGGGYRIQNLNISLSHARVGLFETIGAGGTVKNLGVSGTVTHTYTGSGDNFVGGITGQSTGTITNCYNEAVISSTSNYAAGIVGMNSSTGRIANCYNTGNISGSNSIGGIAGRNRSTSSDASATIENCYNSGDITGNGSVGGIAGDSLENSKLINCFNTGNVIGSNSVGGIVGNLNSATATVSSCVSLGLTVSTSTGTNIGRVWGVNGNAGLMSSLKARADMVVIQAGNPVTPSPTGPNTRHGESIAVDGSVSLSGAGGVFSGWDTTIWDIPAGNLTIGGALPTLLNTGGTQNPVLP